MSSQRLISMQSGCFPQNLPYLFSLCLEGRRPVKKLNPLQPSLSALGRYGWDTGVVRTIPRPVELAGRDTRGQFVYVNTSSVESTETV